LRKALELQPGLALAHAYLSTLAVVRGQADIALREAELEPSEANRDAAIAIARFARGDRKEADATLQQLVSTHGDRRPALIAVVYAYRREPDKMFEWLNRAYELREPFLVTLPTSSLYLDPYHSDARFVALCNKIGVPVPK
jgi:serine/threonine-protein kinase